MNGVHEYEMQETEGKEEENERNTHWTVINAFSLVTRRQEEGGF